MLSSIGNSIPLFLTSSKLVVKIHNCLETLKPKLCNVYFFSSRIGGFRLCRGNIQLIQIQVDSYGAIRFF